MTSLIRDDAGNYLVRFRWAGRPYKRSLGTTDAVVAEAGRARVSKIVARDGDIESWATNDLGMDELGRLASAERTWAIEEYHRGLKQYCGVERSQARGHTARRDHIGLAIRASLRLEWHRYRAGVSWAEAEARIIREAVRGYVTRPLYVLPGTA
jgi:hypothetical protein